MTEFDQVISNKAIEHAISPSVDPTRPEREASFIKGACEARRILMEEIKIHMQSALNIHAKQEEKVKVLTDYIDGAIAILDDIEATTGLSKNQREFLEMLKGGDSEREDITQ